jgi:hypothetical protein
MSGAVVSAAALSLAEFFDGVRTGEVYVQRCAACGELSVPPKAFCPSCQGPAWERARLRGDGEVASFTIIRVPPAALAAEAPYAVVVVRMAEGVSLLGRTDGIALDALRVGLPVRVAPSADPAASPPVIRFRSRAGA